MIERRSRGRPKADDLAAIEDHLIREASLVFFDKGYGHATMAAVAAAARVSKTTLYSRFPTKADLFRAMVAKHTAERGSGPSSTPIETDTSVRELLLAYGDLAIRAGTSPEFIHINRLLYSESGRFPELAAIAEERMKLGVEYLTDEIAARLQREAGEYREPREIAELFLTLLSGWLSTAILTSRLPDSEQRRAWAHQATELFVGAGPLAGKANLNERQL